jgi:ribosomal-protein-serine acetyltransferase
VTAAPQALLLDIPERLETANLTLAATRAGMGEAIHGAIMESLGDLKRWMPWARDDQTLDETEAYCRRTHAKWIARDELDFCFFARAGGGFVGKGGLHTIDWTVPKFEIGYWIRTSCAGRGFASEATGALVGLARDRLGARRIEITSDARNERSRRVAEKNGFALEGILRNARRNTAGDLADKCMYAIVF